jgi:hypothetical protein
MFAGVEVADFAAKLNLEVPAVKPLHEPDSASSGTHCFPDVVQFAAKGGDDAETGHYNSTT